MNALQKLEREQEKIVKNALRSLRKKAPSVYQDLILKLPPQVKAGLGAIDWSKIGSSVINAYVDTSQYKSISSEERKAAEIELKKLQEQTRITNAQIKMQREQNKLQTFANNAQIAGGSLLDQLKAKPWAAPLLVGLSVALVRSIMNRRPQPRGR